MRTHIVVHVRHHAFSEPQPKLVPIVSIVDAVPLHPPRATDDPPGWMMTKTYKTWLSLKDAIYCLAITETVDELYALIDKSNT